MRGGAEQGRTRGGDECENDNRSKKTVVLKFWNQIPQDSFLKMKVVKA